MVGGSERPTGFCGRDASREMVVQDNQGSGARWARGGSVATCTSGGRLDSGCRPQRLAYVFDARSDVEIWREVLPRLLAKTRLPRVFKAIRPIAFQNASARIWSRLVFARFGVFDESLDECSMGFKRGHSVHEVSLIFRFLRVAISFCGSARLGRAHRKGVPLNEALWYIRDPSKPAYA